MRAQPVWIPGLPPVLAIETFANWDVGGREVSLYGDDEGLKFSIKRRNSEHYELRDQPVSLVAYRSLVTYYMRNELRGLPPPGALASRFRDIIHISLHNEVDTTSFLPVYFTDAPLMFSNGQHRPANLQVALFGRIRDQIVNGQLAQTVIGAHWGVFHPASGAIEHFEANAECVATKTFLERDLREFDSYAKRFRPVLACDATNRIQSVALRHVSLFDRDILLDEQNWALTLVSTKGRSVEYPGVGCGSEAGHAMIGYEGVTEGHRFLKYAHITTLNKDPRIPDPGRNSDEARVEIRDSANMRITLESLYIGPTWPRTKDLVERMLRPIKEAAEAPTYVRFAQNRDVAAISLHATGIGIGVAGVIGTLIAGPPIILSTRNTVQMLSNEATVRAARAAARALARGMRAGRAVEVGRVIRAARAGLAVFKFLFLTAVYLGVTSAATVAIAATLPASQALTIVGGGIFFGRPLVNRLGRIAECDNCLSWSLKRLLKGKIEIKLPRLPPMIRPPDAVNYLRSHPEAVVFHT